MHPILFKIGPLNVYSYGVMVAVGFGLSLLLIYRNSARFNIDGDRIIDLAIIVLAAGLVGARALHVILNLAYYRANPNETLDLSRGGLAWHGAFLAALIATILYTKKKKMDFWELADLAAPYIALAQAIGRTGCFLNGCCFGAVVPQGSRLAGIIFPGSAISRYPTQVYSALLLFLIFLVLLIWQKNRTFKGEIFLGYCVLYSIKRLGIEFLRADNPKIICGLTLPQLISIFILSVSLVMLVYKIWKRR